MDALIAKAASTADGKVRNQTYCQIATQVANDLPRALLYETLEVIAYHTHLQNLSLTGSKGFHLRRGGLDAQEIGCAAGHGKPCPDVFRACIAC